MALRRKIKKYKDDNERTLTYKHIVYTWDRLDLTDICLSPCNDDADDEDRIALGCMPIA